MYEGTVPLSQWFAVPHNQTNRAAVNSRTFTKAQSSSIDFDRCGPERRRNDGGKAQARIIDAVFPPQIGYQEDRIRCSQLVFIDCTCGANPVCWRNTIIQALYWITYRGSWRQLSCNCHDILNMQPDFRSIGPFGAGTIETRYELSWRVEEKWVIGYPRSVLISNTGSAGS